MPLSNLIQNNIVSITANTKEGELTKSYFNETVESLTYDLLDFHAYNLRPILTKLDRP